MYMMSFDPHINHMWQEIESYLHIAQNRFVGLGDQPKVS